MMANIELDFRNAKRQADKLEQLAMELERLAANKFDDTMNDLSAHWKGDNANAYLQKAYHLETDMKDTASDMRKTANQIRRTAKKIYDAEMYAREVAERRAYRRG